MENNMAENSGKCFLAREISIFINWNRYFQLSVDCQNVKKKVISNTLNESCVVIWSNYLENCHKVRKNEEDNFFQKSFWNVNRWMLKNDRITGLVLISSKSSSSSLSRKTFTAATLPITAAIFRLIFHLFQRDWPGRQSCDKKRTGSSPGIVKQVRQKIYSCICLVLINLSYIYSYESILLLNKSQSLC